MFALIKKKKREGTRRGRLPGFRLNLAAHPLKPRKEERIAPDAVGLRRRSQHKLLSSTTTYEREEDPAFVLPGGLSSPIRYDTNAAG